MEQKADSGDQQTPRSQKKVPMNRYSVILLPMHKIQIESNTGGKNLTPEVDGVAIGVDKLLGNAIQVVLAKAITNKKIHHG